MEKKNILKDSCKSAWIPVDQVLIVEGILRNSDEPIIKQSDLKADLPENIDNITLESILTYLESMHKIIRSKKGIMYVPEPSAKLKSALKKGTSSDILAVKARKKDAQKIIEKLRAEDNLNHDYKITSEGDFIIIPVNRETKLITKLGKVRTNLEKLQRKKGGDLRNRLLERNIPEKIIKEIPSSYDIVGDIIITSIPEELVKKYSKKIADSFLELHPKIKVILNKKSEHKGIFRTQKMNIIYGEKRKETILKENKCLIKVDVEKVFYSTRLSAERKRIAGLVKNEETIGVFFAGVGPFALAIAKEKNVKEIVAIELNPVGVKYLKENIKLNKLEDIIVPVLGDVKKVSKKYRNYFDRIVMPLPKTSDIFLDSAIYSIKDKGKIHIYRFTKKDDPFTETIEIIKKMAEKKKIKAKILNKIILKSYSPSIVEIVVDIEIKK